MKIILLSMCTVLAAWLAGTTSCNEVHDQIPTHSNYIPPKRDSIQIQYALEQWGKQQVPWFVSGSEHGDIYPNPIIDTLFYDSTHTKFIGTVILEYDPAQKSFENEVLNLNGVYIIGYRSDTNSMWKIFQFDVGKYALFGSKDKLSNTLRNKLYYGLKGQGEACSDSTKNTATRKDLYFISNQYNLYTPGFWTKSPYWTKSLRIKGHYNFETTGNIGWDDPEPLETRVIVQYPDSILSLFAK